MPRRLLHPAAAALLILTVAGCEENNPVVLETGTARLFPSAPGDGGLRLQDLHEAERYVQAAKWEFASATFSYPGVTVDLAATPSGEPCRLAASVALRDPTASSANGACRLGVVIDAIPEAVPATLSVSFTMTLYRAKPDLIRERLGGTATDWDGDTLLNLADPCPILPNRRRYDPVLDQEIDECSFLNASGQFQVDSDADGISDAGDNCVWVANPGQANDIGGEDDGLGISDGIGDACKRQEAVTPQVEITFDATDLVQPRNVPSFVVLDFNLARISRNCDWDSGVCPLDPSTVGYCITTDASAGAFVGCVDPVKGARALRPGPGGVDASKPAARRRNR